MLQDEIYVFARSWPAAIENANFCWYLYGLFLKGPHLSFPNPHPNVSPVRQIVFLPSCALVTHSGHNFNRCHAFARFPLTLYIDACVCGWLLYPVSVAFTTTSTQRFGSDEERGNCPKYRQRFQAQGLFPGSSSSRTRSAWSHVLPPSRLTSTRAMSRPPPAMA